MYKRQALHKAEQAERAEKQRAAELRDALKQVTAEQHKTKHALKNAERNLRSLSNSYIELAENTWDGHGNAALAHHYLDLIPEGLRYWEWGYLKRKYQLDCRSLS